MSQSPTVPADPSAEAAEHSEATLTDGGSSSRPEKKPKAERPPRPPKTAGVKSKSDGAARQQRKKRGPARPHRRLDIDTINTRITKLEKRQLRAKEQLEDATRHVDGYRAEREFREQEAANQGSEDTKA